jgi:hypothetical protein
MILRTVSAEITSTVREERTTTSLAFRVELEGSFDRLELETGEIIRDPRSYTSSAIDAENPEVWVEVYRESSGRAPLDEGADRIGSIIYHGPQPSVVSVRLYLNDAEFDRLVDAILRRFLPRTFKLHHRSGVEGEKKRWNNEEARSIPIELATWDFQIDGASPQEDKRLTVISEGVRSLLAFLPWFLVIIVVGFAALYWKK